MDQQHQGKLVEYPPDWGWGRLNRPVINVSWDDAKAYTRWLSEKTHQEYRLPSEAEWEYAARAGADTAYWWGQEFNEDHANCSESGFWKTTVRDRYPPNPWGLHDTTGNVWEWVNDWHAPYPADPVIDPAGPHEGHAHVLRGRSFNYYPNDCRAAFRRTDTLDFLDHDFSASG